VLWFVHAIKPYRRLESEKHIFFLISHSSTSCKGFTDYKFLEFQV
jgi:hypothetical protein